MRRLALVSMLAQLVLAAGCSDTPPLERYELGGDFRLTGASGKPFQLSTDSAGVRLLFFGFTSCPDVCPTTMSRLGQALQALPASAVEVLFVSVDPIHDTPARLAQYAADWDFPVRGLTGSADDIRTVVANYGASFQPAAGGGFDHSTRVYLLDGAGLVRFLFSNDDPVSRIVDVTESLLEEDES